MLGEYWEKLFGPQYYSFDHKGMNFVVLNSILTYDEWTHRRWPAAEQRMAEMAGLDKPNGLPFRVDEKQRQWLKDELGKVDKKTPSWFFPTRPCRKFTMADADEFTDADEKRLMAQFDAAVQQGRSLWSSPALGSNGVACAQCHPNAANTHP